MTWLSFSTDRTPSKAETTKMARALPTIYEKSQGGFGVLSPIAEVAGSPQARRPNVRSRS